LYVKSLTKRALAQIGRAARRRPVPFTPPGPVRSALVVSAHWTGDVMMSTPAIRALALRYPEARITSLTAPRGRDVLAHNPYVDRVIADRAIRVDRTREPRVPLHRKVALGRRLRGEGYDLAVDLTGVIDSTLVVLLIRAGTGVGFSGQGLGWLYDVEARPRPGLHLVNRSLDVVAAIGVEPAGLEPDYVVTDKERTWSRAALAEAGLEPGRFVALGIGAGWPAKRWPALEWAAFASMVSDRAGFGVVVLGGPGDAADARVIADACPTAVNLAGRTTVARSAALAAEAAVYVGNDSGLAHVAAAFGAPTVVIFGPTDPALCGPIGRRVTFVRERRYPFDRDQAKWPRPEAVFQALSAGEAQV
jgi:lipopolysaccharide heptosyltransferase II